MDPIVIEIAQRLAKQLESQKSVEIRVRTGVSKHGATMPSSSESDSFEDHYIETAAGQRFCEFQGMLAGKITSRFVHYGTGSRFADVNFDPQDTSRQAVVLIKRQYFQEDKSDRKELPIPLLYYYVGREPLHQALNHARHIGEGEVIGRKCEVFLFPKVRWSVVQDQVFYLDRATSTPLKFESFRDQASRERKEPIAVWTAKSLEKLQGRFVAVDSSAVAFGQEATPLVTWDFHVESIAFDKVYPSSMFWPTFQPGVTVSDALTAKTYQVPGGKTTTPVSKQAPATSAQPVQAVPPQGWMGIASGTTTAIGCVLLLSAAALWWNRRTPGKREAHLSK